MTDSGCKELITAILLQAVKDYQNTNNKNARLQILKELRSEYLNDLTDELSLTVASQLEKKYQSRKKLL